MAPLRSKTVTHGRNMAGARASSSPPGSRVKTSANRSSPSRFVHAVRSRPHAPEAGGEIVSEAVHAAGGVPLEFNTIAVDDGIAMGHGGMLYSLPSRDLIVDSVEYMVNAPCANALVCISNWDKIKVATGASAAGRRGSRSGTSRPRQRPR